ncbi:DUF5063 domain-containing protein [bacterium]|nr:DUF5063 domain-containing protein [bacterium]
MKEIINTISKFLAIIESNCSNEEAINNLMLSLDELALVSHSVTYEFDVAEHPDAPNLDALELRKKVCKRFPSLGYYNIVADIGEKFCESEIHVGDAIDDVTEIAQALSAVIWYSDNTSISNALYHFQFGFRCHWGRHLRELQLYLYDQVWG